MLTIGQLAAYAGVTVRAVRHYHRRGLLAEPPRDASGYRRYGAAHAIALVKIRTLAAAGVPLARVRELLAAEPEPFAEAMAEIDRSLRERVAELLRTRERIARLRAAVRPFVSAEVADYLDRLRELGVSRRAVELERDVWTLLEFVSPQATAAWIADKRDAVDDPEFRALYLAYDAAFDWSADDPRLPALADRTLRWMQRRPTRSAGDPGPNADAGGAGPNPDAGIVELVTGSFAGSSPALDRLAELVRQRQAGG